LPKQIQIVGRGEIRTTTAFIAQSTGPLSKLRRTALEIENSLTQLYKLIDPLP
jgi:hypothetical protein